MNNDPSYKNPNDLFNLAPEIMQTILQYAPDAVITIDAGGTIMSWNPKGEELFGWKEKEVIGQKLTDTIIPLRYREQHERGIKHFLATGEGPVMNKPIEIFALRKDGSEFPVELKISHSKINEGIVFIGFIRDITIRKKIEETITNKTALLEEAQQLAHIGSWEWDIRANKIEWSDELFRIFGLRPQEFEASYENYLTYIHPEDKEHVNSTVQEAIRTHHPFQFFHRIIRKDGAVRTISSTGKVIVDSDDNPVRLAGTAQDVTKQKKYELQLKEKNEQLERMNKELQSFAYISSHDLQEPLRKIQTFTSRILEKEQLSESGKDYFGRMQDAAARMQQLIEDLLSYSRAGADERKFEIVDLSAMLEEVKADYRELIEEKNALIESPELCDVKVIPFQFRQLLYNLIGNSLKFSNPEVKPHIVITSKIIRTNAETDLPLQPDSEYCHLSFSDNGIGFNEEYNEKIFEVFQRLHGREEYSGTGIGLSIVKKIVENHNGFIAAHGIQGVGATFDVYLPYNH